MAENWRRSRRKAAALRAVDALALPVAAWLHWRRRGQRNPPPAKILILEFWQLGDAVLAEPFLRALRGLFPAAELVLLCKDGTRTLLEPAGLVDRFIVADLPWTAFTGKYGWRRIRDARLLALVRQLRRERFDVTLDARMDPRSNLLALATGAPRRIGIDAPGGSAMLTDRVEVETSGSHKTEDWLALLPALGGTVPRGPAAYPRLRRPDAIEEPAAARRHAAGRISVAIHPSSSQPVRRWPVDRFAALIRRLQHLGDVDVAVIIPPDEHGAELAGIPGVAAVRPSLEQLPTLLARHDLLIGNDSGPCHIAAAVGASTVTIFGPQRPDWYAPRGPRHHRIAMLADVPCRPCFDQCRFRENYCVTGVTVDAVWAEVASVLDSLRVERGVGGGADQVGESGELRSPCRASSAGTPL